MNEPKIRILIIEDNPGDVYLIEEFLSEIRFKSFELFTEENLKSGIEFLNANSVDIVLLDLSLPDSSGLATFTRLHNSFPNIPAILLTGLDDEEMALTSVQAGAQDYLVKGAINSTILNRAIIYAIERSVLLKTVQTELDNRKKVEVELTKVNRALKVLSEGNQIVVRSRSEEELFKNICRILVEVGEFCLAWIAFVNSDAEKQLQIIFHYSQNPKFDSLKESALKDYEFWQSNIGRAIEAKKIFYCNDISIETKDIFLFNEAVHLGCNSIIALPLIHENKVIGFLSIFSEEREHFSDEEIKLLSELTDDLLHGIGSIRMQRERERTLINLKESEERYRFIVENTNNVIYQLRFDTMKYQYINPAIEKLTGYTAGEINDIGFDRIIEKISNIKFEGETIEEETIRLNRQNNIAGKLQADYLIRTKEGESKWLTDYSYPWFDENGNLLGAAGIISNITERKQAEDEIIKAKEQAEEMNRLKSNFLSNMSHELRTPMVGILGYSEIMRNDAEDAMTKRMANLVYLSGTRLMETLNLILDLSRLEAGKIEMKFSEIEIIRIIKTVLKEFEEQSGQKKLYLKIKTDYSSLWYSSDERMVKNVLTNLINNAVKFTSVGGVTVEISASEEENRKYVAIKVIDTGIGISKEDQKIMWDEFRQASEGFNRCYEGTGLGLTLTKKFVEKLGGSITVESELKKGSAFILKFPVYHFSVTYNENISKSSSENDNSNESNKNLPKILVVDDDETSRNVMSRFLAGQYLSVCVEDANEAIVRANNEQYDAVLMDINLGKGMNGLEATKIIRKLAGYKEVPIIAVTAYAMKGDKEEFLAAGCSEYISKPFSKAQFLPFIQKVLLDNKLAG